MRSLSWRVSVCAVVGAAGCAARQVDVSRLPSEVMSGHVTTSATGAWFTPCAPGSSKWLVTFMEASIQQAERAKGSGLLANGEATYVR
jgi:hypothetical protein